MSSSTIPGFADAPTKNKRLLAWVQEVAELTTPDRIEWCDGSDAEWDRLTQELVASFLSLGRLLGLVMVISAIEIVLLSVLSTLFAVLYNFSVGFTGGVEYTFTDRS